MYDDTTKIDTPSVWPSSMVLRMQHAGGDRTFIVDDLTNIFTVANERWDRTRFFRYPELNELITDEILKSSDGQKVLSLPASIGCEAYSLSATFAKRMNGRALPEIHMGDISEAKLQVAKTGVYPMAFKSAIPLAYRKYFTKSTRDKVIIPKDQIANNVHALPAFDVMDQPEMTDKYHTVMAMNLLCYLPDRMSQLTTLGYLASLTTNSLAFSFGTSANRRQMDELSREVMAQLGFVDRGRDYLNPESAMLFQRANVAPS